MRTLGFAFCAILLFGCATPTLNYSGGDGSVEEKAVIIKGVKDTEGGIDAENAWIQQHFPRARKTEQALVSSGRKHFDVISITLADGQKRDIWFDITSFFGM